ncbi:MAG: EAL domain-containing protein [Rhodocyclaceae bacterium]|nr:EAL domain-containing protein [Rhodocyclaceae bacterium]
MRFRHKLSTRILVLAVVAQTAVIALFAGYLAEELSVQETRAATQASMAVAGSIARAGTNALVSRDLVAFERILRQAVHNRGVMALNYVNPQGRALIRVEPGAGAGAVEKLSYDPDQTFTLPPDAGQQVRQLADRLETWQSVEAGSVLGWVRIEYSLAEAKATSRRIWLDAVAVALAGMLAYIVLFSYFLKLPMRVLRVAAEFAGSLSSRHGAQLDIQSQEIELNAVIEALNKTSVQLHMQQEELQMAALVYKASAEAMFITDAANRVVAVNPAFTHLTGYTPEEVLGKDPKILGSSKNSASFYRDMWQSLKKTGQWQGEIWNKRKNGEEFAEWLTINTIFDDAGGVHRRVSLFSDITEMKKAEETIWQQANYDLLTGLPNRRLFRDRLQQELRNSRREKLPLALLSVDLDRFKEINDAFGHAVGDQLLVEIAKRLASCLRESDTVARTSGDGFGIALTRISDPGAAERIAQTVLQKLAEPLSVEKEAAYISACVGITLYPNDAEDMETLLKNAEEAMYVAKKQGRGGVSWFTQEMQEAAHVRLSLLKDLRHALADGQFEVYFQPIVDLKTGRVEKAEALLRWHHPERGMVSPAVFIPLAEEVGLIQEIGDWVFRQVVDQAKAWRDAGLTPLQIAVNKSPRQFMVGNSQETWLDYLTHKELPPECLVIEVTEGLLMESHEDVPAKLRRFRAAGITIAIDDFGTGYSSLSYLQKFDIDFLKIDRSFVMDIASDSDDRALAEAIVVMAHKLGLKVVAEGVETEVQRDYLIAAGCDYMQGFLFAKAMPAADFEKLLRSRAAA